MSDLAVFYEHPHWFEPLFAALDRRGLSCKRIPIAGHVFDPADPTPPAPLVFNRLAMSAVSRGDEHPIFYAAAALAHWELAGARVVNGSAALAIDASKARQLALLRALGLDTPATRVVHRRSDLVEAAESLRFPVVVKANIGGAGAGIARYDSLDDLAAFAADGATPTGVDGVALVQEYVPARDGRVFRCETLAGRFLYALEITGAGTFDLCPADACSADRAAAGASAIRMTAYTPPPAIVQSVETVARAAHLDVGGVEYMVDDRDGRPRFYDINALSNFVARPVEVLGYDPHDRLVDQLERWLAEARGEAA